MLVRTLILAALCVCTSANCADDDPTASATTTGKATVGKPAPDFTATNIEGQEFKLSDKLKDTDQPVVLVFSRASW